ncbi:MAG: nuclear transport factor 2 family protein [Proteobacteria bacterium]|nr:nuclear transport factor 2 family protein [Pseudomonadota bacterium]
MANDTSGIETFLAQWIAAFNAHDLDAHMALYLEDATLFGAVDELQVGRAAIREYFKGRAPDVKVRVYPMPRVTMLSPDIAVTAGHVDFADGDTPVPYRMTWVLVKRGGSWRIAQHHGSPRRGK